MAQIAHSWNSCTIIGVQRVRERTGFDDSRLRDSLLQFTPNSSPLQRGERLQPGGRRRREQRDRGAQRLEARRRRESVVEREGRRGRRQRGSRGVKQLDIRRKRIGTERSSKGT